MQPDAMILVFWMLSFKPTFSLSLDKMSHSNDGKNIFLCRTFSCGVETVFQGCIWNLCWLLQIRIRNSKSELS